MKEKVINKFTNVLIVVIATLCLMLSATLMAIGFREFYPDPKWVFSPIAALIVCLVFIFLNFQIHRERMNRAFSTALAGWLLAYLVAAVPSFIGTFNTVYSNLMGAELLRAEIVEKRDTYDRLAETAKNRLSSSATLRPELNKELANLESQIRNNEEPGCGPKCDIVLGRIEDLLKSKITRLRGGEKEALLQDYKKIIESAYQAKTSATNDVQRNELIAVINQDLDTLKPKADEAIASPLVNYQGRIVIKDFIDKYKELGTKTQALLGVDAVEYNPQIKFVNEELGKISHSFSSAYMNNDRLITWIAIFFSLLLDFFVPSLILLGTRQEQRQMYSYPYLQSEI